MSIQWKRGQTYHIVIFRKLSEEELPCPYCIFKEFVCIDVGGMGCAAQCAWNLLASPKKHPKQEPWCNPKEIFDQMNGAKPNEFEMRDVKNVDDVDFLIKVLEDTQVVLSKGVKSNVSQER